MAIERTREASAERLKEMVGADKFADVIIKYQTMPYSSEERRAYFNTLAQIVDVSGETLKRALREYISKQQLELPKTTRMNPPNYHASIPRFESDSFCVYGCAHIPYHNPEKMDMLYYVLKSEKLRHSFSIGDSGEFRSNSRHPKRKHPIANDITSDEANMAVREHFSIVQDLVEEESLIFGGNHDEKVYVSSEGNADWRGVLRDSKFDDKTTFLNWAYGFVRHPQDEDGISLTKLEHLSQGYNKNPLQAGHLKGRGDRGLALKANEYELFNWIYAHLHNGAIGKDSLGWAKHVSLGTFADTQYMDYLYNGQNGYPQWNSLFVFFKKGKLNLVW